MMTKSAKTPPKTDYESFDEDESLIEVSYAKLEYVE